MRRASLLTASLVMACRPSPVSPPPSPRQSAQVPDSPPPAESPDPAEALETSSPAPPPTSPIPPKRLATGGVYNCVVRDGEVYCWGLDRNHPPGEAFHVELEGEAVEVAAGREAACARTRAGAVECWNEYAQYRIEGVGRAVSIGVGFTHACAAEPEGVRCWTPNFTRDEAPVAREVHDVTDPVAVAAGFYHACALERGGTVRCWGRDEQGALGASGAKFPTFSQGKASDDGWLAIRIDPRERSFDFETFWKRTRGLESALLRCVRDIGGATSMRFLALELTVDDQGLPTDVGRLDTDLGEYATEAMTRCATKALFDGPSLVPTSGGAATVGVFLIFASRGRALRQAHPVVDDAVALASRGYFSCAALRSGSVECWGITHGFDGPGIHGTRLESPGQPGEIEGLADLESLSIGWRHACGRREDGSHVCFGGNGEGTFGPAVPIAPDYGVHDIDPGRDYVEISAGPTLTCGIKADDSVWCWGINDGGRLGTADETPGARPPAPVVGLPTAAASTRGPRPSGSADADP